MSCPICNSSVPVSYGQVERTYCSNACKQKAYRARKKQERLANEQSFCLFDFGNMGIVHDHIVSMSKHEFVEVLKHAGILDGVKTVKSAYETLGVAIGALDGGMSS